MLSLTRIAGRRTLASLVAVGMLCSLSACTGSNNSQQSQDKSEQQSTTLPKARGDVHVLLPSDSFTLSTKTPLNTWSELASSMSEQLQRLGYMSDDISITRSDDIEKQISALQDELDNLETKGEHTLIIAPALVRNDIRKQYGDYVSDETFKQADAQLTYRSSSESDAAEESENQEPDIKSQLATLAQLIDKAQQQEVHVIELGDPASVLTPDCVVDVVSAYQIGASQAQELVNKLDVAHASKSNPIAVEVFIPHGEDSAFAQSMFEGVWSVLGEYYHSGVIISPSDTLTTSSSEHSWSAVALSDTSSDAMDQAIQDRLYPKQDGEHKEAQPLPKLDGVLSGNDAMAQHVITALSKAGYTGSSATVNPNISIGGIVKQLVGESDINRNQVPAPKSTDSTSDESQTRVLAWPIITGYGAYTSNLTDIIDGSQWSTSLVNRTAVAQSIAGITLALNTDHKPKTVVRDIEKLTKKQAKSSKSTSQDQSPLISNSKWDTVTVATERVPRVAHQLLAVSASNLKSVLIDGGYISPADAGL